MNRSILLWMPALLLLVSACSNKQRSEASSQLIASADEYGYDTVVAVKGDTICNREVDDVLRHYPEFYHAARQARKAYQQWAGQERKSGLKTQPEVMDLTTIIDETLYGRAKPVTDSAWQALPAIDSLYLRLIGSVAGDGQEANDKKSEIGRTRKAWQAYTTLLQRMENTVPEDCQQRYCSVVAERINRHLIILQQSKDL